MCDGKQCDLESHTNVRFPLGREKSPMLCPALEHIPEVFRVKCKETQLFKVLEENIREAFTVRWHEKSF